MKFLSTMRLDRAEHDTAALKAKLSEAKEFFKSQAGGGAVESAYASLEHPVTIYSVISADSHEAVLKMIASNPLASIATICVKPLADVSAAFAVGDSQLK